MSIDNLREKCKTLLDKDVIGYSTYDSVMRLLNSFVISCDPYTSEKVVHAIDDLLGELEQERVISDCAIKELKNN